MDRSKHLKRPRSTTPTKETPTKSKRSKQKRSNKELTSPPEESSKKSRRVNKSSRPSSTSASLPRDTSTEDGELMSKILSTFTKVEQSRFEAFQRSTIPPRDTRAWLSQLLSHRYNLPEVRDLENLVAPGQASDITMIVNVLTKIYVQRLIGKARKLAMKSSINNTGEEQNPKPLSIRDLQMALGAHSADDFGFFMQPKSRRTNNLRLSSEVFEQDRSAAMAAQEAYDKYISSTENNMDADE